MYSVGELSKNTPLLVYFQPANVTRVLIRVNARLVAIISFSYGTAVGPVASTYRKGTQLSTDPRPHKHMAIYIMQIVIRLHFFSNFIPPAQVVGDLSRLVSPFHSKNAKKQTGEMALFFFSRFSSPSESPYMNGNLCVRGGFYVFAHLPICFCPVLCLPNQNPRMNLQFRRTWVKKSAQKQITPSFHIRSRTCSAPSTQNCNSGNVPRTWPSGAVLGWGASVHWRSVVGSHVDWQHGVDFEALPVFRCSGSAS